MKDAALKKSTIILLSSVIVLVSVLIYQPTIRSGFIWDDTEWIFYPLKLGSNPYGLFFGGGAYYRPLVILSFLLDSSFWHLNSVGYHITNILLHSLNSLLVFLLSFQLIKRKETAASSTELSAVNSGKMIILSFAAALLFALHPVHTESVAWISARTDILATFFFLLAFLSFLTYEKEGKTVGLIISGVFFLFSLFSKEIALSFIVLVFAYGIMTKMPWRKIVLSLSALSAVTFIYMLLRQGAAVKMMTAAPGSGEAFFQPGISAGRFMLMLSGSLSYYFEKLLFPFNLNLLPQLPEHPMYFFIFLLPFVFGGILFFAGRRLEAFLTTWVIATLLPSLAILFSQVAWPLGERYLYLPSVGFSILMGLILLRIPDKKALSAGVLALCIVYAASTHQRLKAWADEASLWGDTVRKNPQSAVAHSNLGKALLERNEFERGKSELLTALKQKDISFHVASITFNLLGAVELKDKNYENAEKYFDLAVKTNPKNAVTYHNLGVLHLRLSEGRAGKDKKERLDEAVRNLKKALSLSPNFIQPKFDLAVCYLKMRDFDNAEKYFYSVIETDPLHGLSADAQQFLMLIEFAKLERQKGVRKTGGETDKTPKLLYPAVKGEEEVN